MSFARKIKRTKEFNELSEDNQKKLKIVRKQAKRKGMTVKQYLHRLEEEMKKDERNKEAN